MDILLPAVFYREDNDDMERSELRRRTLELETEISLTNPLVVQLESRLTRRPDMVKAESQNRSVEGTRVVNVHSILASNSGVQVTSKQWNDEAVNKPSAYVASGRLESAMTRSTSEVGVSSVTYVNSSSSFKVGQSLCNEFQSFTMSNPPSK